MKKDSLKLFMTRILEDMVYCFNHFCIQDC
jgi:hypothetical protein